MNQLPQFFRASPGFFALISSVLGLIAASLLIYALVVRARAKPLNRTIESLRAELGEKAGLLHHTERLLRDEIRARQDGARDFKLALDWKAAEIQELEEKLGATRNEFERLNEQITKRVNDS